jgi:hypothetical protein
MYAYTCYKIKFYVQKLEQNYVQSVSSTNVPLQLHFKGLSIGMPRYNGMANGVFCPMANWVECFGGLGCNF